MRIGIIAPPWLPVPPTHYGGTEAVVDLLARGLVAAGHDVLLWTTGDATCDVNKGHVLERAATDEMGFIVTEMRHLIAGYTALVEWGADIIHDHTLIGPLYAQSAVNVPVVTTNHGPFDETLGALYRVVGRRTPVIAISHDHASRAPEGSAAAVIHHGLDPEMFQVGDGAGDERGEYFVFLGRMAPEKGARQAAVAAKAAGVRLLLAAKLREPAEHLFFNEHVQPLLDDDVEYIGEVDHAKKVELLGAARALVNPIRWPEPFGLVMVESLACGTPVLAFKEGSAPELVEHDVTGFLCDDIDDMAKRMRDVATLDRSACRSTAEERFSTKRMVADHIRLYEQVLRGARGDVA